MLVAGWPAPTLIRGGLIYFTRIIWNIIGPWKKVLINWEAPTLQWLEVSGLIHWQN